MVDLDRLEADLACWIRAARGAPGGVVELLLPSIRVALAEAYDEGRGAAMTAWVDGDDVQNPYLLLHPTALPDYLPRPRATER